MIYVTGDTHGDYSRLSRFSLRKLRKGDTLFIAGDFGFLFDGSKKEQRILRRLGNRKYNIFFLDGLNENFALLNAYAETEYAGGKVRVIHKNLRYAVRGEAYSIIGTTVFTFGGGGSDTAETPQDGALPSAEDFERAASTLERINNQADYIITHEPPGKLADFLNRQGKVPLVNAGLDKVAEECAFTRWFFGSLHMDKVVSPKYTAVYKKIIHL
ncbi:MAG: metallophosphoesterase [Oscillospiraceae bacterium]|jgi:hypothetical protein|nr:metallophosphoesterase [Oscillospiraceae bacterium]